jgi:hypothetical protein
MQRLLDAGKIEPKSSKSVQKSRIGLGFEKLDRNVFDPEKAYDKVAQLGVKWIRIQSGWARTEREQGEYDFEWLDKIVDNLLQRGLIPWMCLCYGNGLYDEKAAQIFGAVGCPPIYSPEARTAWSNYVEACVRHYIGRVGYYEIWNEPDGIWCWKNGASATEYAEFAIDTAHAIKKADPHAYIVGGAVCLRELEFLDTALKEGMAQCIHGVSFHEYTHHEEQVFERVASLRGICNAYNPSIDIIQGESGSQSKGNGSGALKTGSWTQRKQAKQLLRHTMADLMTEVKFTSYFSCMDMIEALNGTVGDKASYMDYGFFGVLGAEFDENGFAKGEYTPKMSYTALQNICALFSEDFEKVDLPVVFCPTSSPLIFADDLPAVT